MVTLLSTSWNKSTVWAWETANSQSRTGTRFDFDQGIHINTQTTFRVPVALMYRSSSTSTARSLLSESDSCRQYIAFSGALAYERLKKWLRKQSLSSPLMTCGFEFTDSASHGRNSLFNVRFGYGSGRESSEMQRHTGGFFTFRLRLGHRRDVFFFIGSPSHSVRCRCFLPAPRHTRRQGFRPRAQLYASHRDIAMFLRNFCSCHETYKCCLRRSVVRTKSCIDD